MSDTEVHGPIDFILIEFEGGRLHGESSAAIAELVERDIVRLYDVVAVQKGADGDLTVLDLEAQSFGGFEAFNGARSGLLTDEDLATAGELMVPGTTAVLLVYENSWAIPFVAAALREGGSPVATARISALDVIAVLDELDASSPL